ncbi:hypothetical protein [Glycomyces harbinensis]|uniref:Uncharacterized protein n=1 Tax=Glycomyces harbinensis TaxID=58114 RepID=A0A1G6SJU4_9ACTN|nr:hypothetical protein [Glycomyces harbinensis]SDD16416.1 hypothetical protein SAMN05216270_102109 [Glycomyces harbinensis]
MPNSSYLCATDLRSLYPSTTDKGFDPSKGVVAFDVRCVPLLWLAMFRPADLLTQTITVEADPDATYYTFGPDGDFVEIETPPEEAEDQNVEATALLAPRDRALAQLDAAVPVLGRLFAAEGPLEEHAAMLRRAVAASPGAYLTVELDEIEGLWEPGTFQPALRAALESLDGEGDPEAGRVHLIELAQLRPGRPFPPARLLLDDGESADDDIWNLVRLLGASFSAPVPWEPSTD